MSTNKRYLEEEEEEEEEDIKDWTWPENEREITNRANKIVWVSFLSQYTNEIEKKLRDETHATSIEWPVQDIIYSADNNRLIYSVKLNIIFDNGFDGCGRFRPVSTWKQKYIKLENETKILKAELEMTKMKMYGLEQWHL